ncbi:MAG: hypothetical protein NZ899_08835 [Thermoguttaceae bacterium]|nr:hypothetical protein [Thermoguttaceae bacterium]
MVIPSCMELDNQDKYSNNHPVRVVGDGKFPPLCDLGTGNPADVPSATIIA